MRVRRLAIVGAALCLSAGLALADKAMTRAARAVDSNGKAIGIVVGVQGPGPGMAVLRRDGNTMFLVNVAYFGFTGPVGVPHWETPDCSGQAYLLPVREMNLYYTSIPPDASNPVTSVNYAGDPIETHALWSRRRSGTVFGPCETFTAPFTSVMGPLRTLDLSEYIPPFRLK